MNMCICIYIKHLHHHPETCLISHARPFLMAGGNFVKEELIYIYIITYNIHIHIIHTARANAFFSPFIPVFPFFLPPPPRKD